MKIQREEFLAAALLLAAAAPGCMVEDRAQNTAGVQAGYASGGAAYAQPAYQPGYPQTQAGYQPGYPQGYQQTQPVYQQTQAVYQQPPAPTYEGAAVSPTYEGGYAPAQPYGTRRYPNYVPTGE